MALVFLALSRALFNPVPVSQICTHFRHHLSSVTSLPTPVTSRTFGTGLSPDAVGKPKSHSIIAYDAATYEP